MKISVTSYILTTQSVIAQIESGDMNCGITIPREEYETWLAPDGMVDLSFSHHDGNVQTDVPCSCTIANYWLQGEEINNSPVLEHLYQYLTRTELERNKCKAKLLEMYLDDVLEGNYVAKSKLIELVLTCTEIGAGEASLVYAKILAK